MTVRDMVIREIEMFSQAMAYDCCPKWQLLFAKIHDFLSYHEDW